MILGNNPESETTIAQLNAAFVDRLIQGAQQQEEAREKAPIPETWIFLDELSLAVKSASFVRFCPVTGPSLRFDGLPIDNLFGSGR